MKYFLSLLLFLSINANPLQAQNQWDGDNPIGEFLYGSNWFGDVVPATWNSSTDLLFELCNHPSQTSIYYNFTTWSDVRSVIYQATFPRAIPFDANGNGLNFWFKIENLSASSQVLNVPLSGKGLGMELNPVNGDMTMNAIIYNDNNINYLVYGPNGKKISFNNILKGGAGNNLAIKQYSIVSIGYPNTAATGSFGNGINVETGELWFEENASINGGVIRVGNGNSNVAKLYLHDLNGGSTLPNAITVPASSTQSYIGALNVSGTNTYSGAITLSAPVQLEGASGGMVTFSGNISGASAVTIDDVGGTGNATIQYTGTAKTYTGATTVNSGATLRISSDQVLGAVTVNAGGKLIVDNGVSLTINGAWTGGGEITNNGTIRLVGPTAFPGSGSTVTAMNILNINRAGAIMNLDNDLVITGSLILTSANFNINAGRKLTLNGASQVNAGGALSGSTTSDYTVSGLTGGTVTIPAAITLRNVLVDGNRVLQLNGTNNLGLNGQLSISSGATFSTGGDASQVNNSGATISVTGTFITMHPGGFIGGGSAVPAVPVTLNAGSTVDYGRAGNQNISSTITYFNIRFSNSGTKTPNSAIAVNTLGTVSIAGVNTIVDASSNNIASTGANTTGFTMDAGRLIIGTGGTQPNMDGVYSLTGGVVEFAGSSAKTIRNKAYQNIEVSGTDVGNSSGNIELNSAGTFTVNSGGLFHILSNSITGPTGAQTVTVKNGAVFRAGNVQGFHGYTISYFPTISSSINSDIENIILEAGSTVDYYRSGDQPITSNPALNYQHLALTGSGNKTAPSGTLTVQGNLTKSVSPSFVHNNGLVLLNGGTQSFAGLAYYGLRLTNGSKTINGSSSIADILQIDASTTFNIPALQTITLLSVSNKTAGIGQLDPSVTINYNGTGKFMVERRLRDARKWRLMAAPTNDGTQTIRSSWQEGGLTGPSVTGYGFWALDTRAGWSALGFDGLGTNGSVKQFNGATETWDPVANTNALPISNQSGYMVFVAGDRNKQNFPGSTPTTLRTSGQLYRNDRVINISASQFATIGNPYASRIDLRQIGLSAQLSQAFYIWDPSIGGAYGLGAWNTFSTSGGNFVNLLGSSIYGTAGTANNYIESGQAVMVRNYTPATPGTATFHETDKVSGSATILTSFTHGQAQQLTANLQLLPQNGEAILLDGVQAGFDAANSNGIEPNDIFKMNSFGESVAIKTAGTLLVIDQRAAVMDEDVLELQLSNMKAQNYQWEIVMDNMDYPGRKAFLIDEYKNSRTPLKMDGTKLVNFTIENIAGSNAPNRFKIVFQQPRRGPFALNNAANATDEVTITKAKPAIHILPNPVTGKQLNLHMEGMDEGVYRMRLFAASGQVLYQTRLVLVKGGFTKTITLPQHIKAGSYRLQISGAGGEDITVPLMMVN